MRVWMARVAHDQRDRRVGKLEKSVALTITSIGCLLRYQSMLKMENALRRSPVALIGLVLSLMVTPLALATVAEAVTINLNIGTNLSAGRGITCREGERLIRSRGFRDVRTVDCRGRFFVYHARRDGSRFEIALNRRDGRVMDFRRVGRR